MFTLLFKPQNLPFYLLLAAAITIVSLQKIELKQPFPYRLSMNTDVINDELAALMDQHTITSLRIKDNETTIEFEHASTLILMTVEPVLIEAHVERDGDAFAVQSLVDKKAGSEGVALKLLNAAIKHTLLGDDRRFLPLRSDV